MTNELTAEEYLAIVGRNEPDAVPKPNQMPAPKVRLIQWLVQTYGTDMIPEYRFHPKRRWRIDFAIRPETDKVGIEYQGMFGGKAHTAVTNVLRDSEKLNEAQLHGWIILQVNAKSLEDGTAYRQIEEAVKVRGDIRGA